jgi:hypothetical protein
MRHPNPASGRGGPCHQVAAPVPLYADRGDGRTYTIADRRRSSKTSTHGGLTNGHLKLHPDLHQLDGRDPARSSSALKATAPSRALAKPMRALSYALVGFWIDRQCSRVRSLLRRYRPFHLTCCPGTFQAAFRRVVCGPVLWCRPSSHGSFPFEETLKLGDGCLNLCPNLDETLRLA